MNWKAQVEWWLRRVAHSDLADLPVYLLASNEIPPSHWIDAHNSGAVGYTHSMLDLLHWSRLERRGEWRGRGFATVIAADVPIGAKIAYSAHELGHWLSERIKPRHRAMQTASADVVRNRWEVDLTATPTVAPGQAQHEFHDLDFCRVCCHLVYRLRRAGFNVWPSGLGIAGNVLDPVYYGNQLYYAFRREYRDDTSSIAETLLTPAPTEALEIWNQHLAQRAVLRAAA